MASAYDTSGRLKKHALLGTSLAVDPTREAERRAFEELHAEAAASPGATRQDFVNRLSQRYAGMESEQNVRLADIARQRGDFETQARGLRDLEKEDKLRDDLSKFRDWTSRYRNQEEFGRNPNPRKWKNLVAREAIDQANKLWRRMTPQEKYEAKLQYGGQQKWMRDYVMSGEGRTRDAQKAYETDLNARIDQINAGYIPLQEEATQRQQRLADRVDLYNLFLGEG